MSAADPPDAALLLDTLPVSVYRVAPDFTIEYVNAIAAAQMRSTPAEIVGQNVGDLGLDPQLWDTWNTELSLAFSTGRASSFEVFCAYDPNRLFEYRLVPELDDNGQVASVLVAGLAIDELRRMRRALAAQEELFRCFMDASPAFAWLRDSDSRYVFLNKAYLNHFGIKAEDRLGKRPADFYPPDVAAQFAANDQAVLASGQPMQVVEQAPSRDGSRHFWLNVKFPFTDSENRRYIGGVGLDITAEKNAEELQRRSEVRLLRAQKMESLGLLAAGAAHDFNNLLTLVVGHANLAHRDVDATSPTAEHLQAIEQASKQMADLCQQMLAFAGHGKREPTPINLNHLAQDTARLMRGMIPRHIAIQFNLAPDLPNILGDETQFRQVLLNLLTNAADALGERAGTINVTTATEVPTVAMLEEAGLEPTPRPFVRLEVRDDGPGMSEEVLARVFEPFFSTKATGRGLGLAAVQGIVRAHAGLISVSSTLGQGTSIRVLIPVA